MLFATHYLEEAEEFADRVILMRGGTIVADGSVAEVRALQGGRTVRAVVPTGYELRADRVSLSSKDSDVTLRALLTRFPDAHDVEVTAIGLEGAFLSLTSEEEIR